MNTQEKKYRYPGVKPFVTEERNLFFGRDEDIEKLFKTVSLEKLTVLYGKSGYGKSSLLNAGVIPKLVESGYTPYTVRFGAYSREQSATLCDIVRQRTAITLSTNTLLDKLKFAENTLWTYFKRATSVAKQPEKIPVGVGDSQLDGVFFQPQRIVLIFDQFEELFTFPENQIADFKRQLAEVLYGAIPQWLRDAVQTYMKAGNQLTNDDKLLLANKLDVKIIFSIRSDRMSLLNALSDYFGTILQNNYELTALTAEQAEDAILFPAALRTGNFITPHFDYEEAALQKILNFLTRNRSQKVESFQLQIVCQFCENLILNLSETLHLPDFKNLADVKFPTDLKIQAEQLGNLEHVFQNHYFRLIAMLPAEQQLVARILFEDGLIIDNNRVTLPEAVILKQAGMNSKLLRLLVDSHLLRSEPNTVGGISYELAHDTLVAPILEARKVRMEQQEEENQLRIKNEELRIAREKAEKERLENEKRRRQLRRTRALLGFAAIGLVLAAIGMAFAFIKQNEANKAKVIAEKQTEIALDKTNIANKALELVVQKQDSLKVAFQQAKLAKDTAEMKRLEAEQAKLNAEKQRLLAEQQRAKAESMVSALMPNEAKTDPFGYFWKLGKQSFAKYDYTQANLQLLLAKDAANKPANMTDSVETLYKKVKPLAEIYQNAIAAFYKNNYTEARKYFAQIKELNPTDSLTRFMYYACGDYQTENMIKVDGGKFHPFAYNDKYGVIDSVEWTLSTYHIAQYEVTNAQYARFLNEKSARFLKSGRLDFADSVELYINYKGVSSNEMKSGITLENGIYKVVFGYENRPVAWVSFFGANAFCRFYGLQLPTEAQWEFAARGGNKNQPNPQGFKNLAGLETLYAGSDTLDLVGWYYENSGSRTHACGTKRPNQLGIYDMSGNLWEWCFDWYAGRSEYKSETNPYGGDDGSGRVLRGGGWDDGARNCRVSYRININPNYRNSGNGFRVVFTY